MKGVIKDANKLSTKKIHTKRVIDGEKEYMEVQGERRWIVLLSRRSKFGGILY